MATSPVATRPQAVAAVVNKQVKEQYPFFSNIFSFIGILLMYQAVLIPAENAVPLHVHMYPVSFRFFSHVDGHGGPGRVLCAEQLVLRARVLPRGFMWVPSTGSTLKAERAS